MKKYVCNVCGYVYDPAEGDPDNGVAAGKALPGKMFRKTGYARYALPRRMISRKNKLQRCSMKMKKILLSGLLLTFVFSGVAGKAVNAMESKKVILDPLPKSAGEIKPANTPQQTAAYAIASLVRYTENAEAGIAMLDVLRGPRPLNNYNKQFLRDQLRGKEYTARSYFDGANPDNNYTPSMPYTLTVSENPYSYQNEGYARLLLKSGGADSQRFITLRLKPSTGEWYLWEYEGLLAGIRIPAKDDPWK